MTSILGMYDAMLQKYQFKMKIDVKGIVKYSNKKGIRIWIDPKKDNWNIIDIDNNSQSGNGIKSLDGILKSINS